MLIFSDDKPRLQRHFEKDKVLFCYHLADLDDFYFPYCQWGVDYHERARIEEAILVYSRGDVPTVMAFGLSHRFPPLLEEMLPLLPPKFLANFMPESRALFHKYYQEEPLGRFLKMKLTAFNKPENNNIDEIIKLDQSHFEQLINLYQTAYPDHHFDSRMLETGYYYGIIQKNQLVGVTGVHAYSDEYRIAVLGNICVHPDFRGQNLSYRLIGHQLEQLNPAENTVCLNVKADNDPAVKVYQKLGFELSHQFESAYFSLK